MSAEIVYFLLSESKNSPISLSVSIERTSIKSYMDFGRAISCVIWSSESVRVIQVEKERSFVVSFRRRPRERHFPFITRARQTGWTFFYFFISINNYIQFSTLSCLLSTSRRTMQGERNHLLHRK